MVSKDTDLVALPSPGGEFDRRDGEGGLQADWSVCVT